MSIYAIGDIQGCYDPLMALLEKIRFNSDKDLLWFAGDLVNRGPKSLQVLRFVKDLGDNAVCVLGNHDLHLLAVAHGHRDAGRRDDFDEILQAGDFTALIDWLRHCPLLHYDREKDFTLVHAGLAPQWTLKQARHCAKEVQKVLRSEKIDEFLAHMYGDQPDLWSKDLQGWERLRFITNSFTRIRYCDADGREDFQHNREIGSQPKHLLPWFQLPDRKSGQSKIIFGHWASLGLHVEKNIYALDSGCVWGGKLTAMRVCEQPAFVQVGC